MKVKYFYSKVGIGLIVLISLFFSSCEKMEDRHKEFIDMGETTYVGKADSVQSRSGRNRLELSWLVLSDPKVNSYKLYWNNRRDSLSGTINRTDKIDTIRVVLDELNEGVYNFEIYTFDNAMNSSVQTSHVARVYGERYQETLLPRTYQKLIREKGDLKIEWANADGEEQLVYTEVRYKNSQGQTIKHLVPSTSSIESIGDLPIGSNFEYRSAFTPIANSLDTFYTDYVTVRCEIQKIMNWSNYSKIFGYGEEALFGLEHSGRLTRFSPSGIDVLSGDYSDVAMMNSYITAGGYFGRDQNGNMIRFLFNDSGRSSAVQFGSGWGSFTNIFPYNGMLIGRLASGVLLRYFFNSAFTYTGSTGLDGIDDPNQYDLLLGLNNMIVGKTTDGKLWGIKLDPNSNESVAEPRFLISGGWNNYEFVSAQAGSLLAKKANGELWKFDVGEKGIVKSEKVAFTFEEWFED